MKSRRDILKAHYTELFKRAATWLGLVALLSTTIGAVPVEAATQMGARSTTATTLAAAATGVSYALSFSPGTTSTIGSMQLEVCDSPLELTSCAASASAGVNSNGASIASATFTSLTGTGCTGGTWAVGTGTGPGVSGTTRRIANSGSAVSPTTAQTCVLTIGAVVNPAGNNQKFYVRLKTYSDTAYTTPVDFGAMALQTAQDIAVTASVQESLTFCTGATVASNCASVGSASVSLATGSGCPIMSTANVCTGTSQMAASTNANAGYAIAYTGNVFTGPSDTITAIGATETSSSPGTKQFGLAITTLSGSGSATLDADYDFGSTGYAYVTTGAEPLAAAAAATAENIFTVTYMGNVSATTKPGLYTATINYICTGRF